MKKILFYEDVSELLEEVNREFENGWDLHANTEGAMVLHDKDTVNEKDVFMCILETSIEQSLDKKIVHGDSMVEVLKTVNTYLEDSYEMVDLGGGDYIASLHAIVTHDYALVIIERKVE